MLIQFLRALIGKPDKKETDSPMPSHQRFTRMRGLIQKLNVPLAFFLNTLMDDKVSSLSYSGIISILAATGIAG